MKAGKIFDDSRKDSRVEDGEVDDKSNKLVALVKPAVVFSLSKAW